MPQRLKIPVELLELYPHLNRNELRSVIMTIWKSKNAIMRQSHIFRIVIPHIGTIRSRANKKPKHLKKTRIKDKRRKRVQAKSEELTIENLLF